MSSNSKEPEMIKPQVSVERAVQLLWDLYGLKVNRVRAMCSYDDMNFHVTVEDDHVNGNLTKLWPHGYTLKVVNSLDTGQEKLLESFQEALFHLKSKDLEVPVPVPNLVGTYCQRIKLTQEGHGKDGCATSTTEVPDEQNEVQFAVFLLTFLPGQTLSSVQYTPDVLRSVGRTLAQVIHAFEEFSNSILEKRCSLWSLWSVPQLEKYVFAIKDEGRRALVKSIIENFTNNVVPVVENHTKRLIHGDLNEHNLIVSEKAKGESPEVSGVLDLGDVHSAPRLFEVAVCLTYSMLGGPERLGLQTDPLLAPGHVLTGLSESLTLTPEERALLKDCIEARLAQSLTMGAYSNHMNPGNVYVLDSSRHGWTVLQKLVESNAQDLLQKWDKMVCDHQ